MTTPPRSVATPFFKLSRETWSTREDDILAGRRIPTILDRRRGHSAFQGSGLLDARQQARIDIDEDIHTDATTALLNAVIDLPTAESCWALYQSMGNAGDGVDLWLWHAALRGHPEAVAEWCADLMTSRDRDRIGHLMGVSVALGMMSNYRAFDGNGLEADDVAELRDHGLGILRRLGETLAEYDLGTGEIENPEPDPERPAKRKLDAALESMAADADFLRLVEEDRAEIFSPVPAAEAPGLVVIPQVLLLRPDSRHRKDIVAAALPHAGKRLPFVGGGRLAEARAALRESHPHCHVQTDKIMNLQAGKPFPQFRMILVGGAGAGKTAYAITLAEALGMPMQVIPAGGAADGSFGGTSSQYSSGRMSTAAQVITQTGVANPVMIVDEADKMGEGRQNGNMGDVLLNFVEPSTAARYLDPGLEATVNLSAVSWILCANSLDTIPLPLRDRCRIIRIPTAGFEHIAPIARRILREIAEDRGFDPDLEAPLDDDELELIGKAWGGGSLRQLTFVLEDFFVNRARAMGMH